jgi:hypothetical protein
MHLIESVHRHPEDVDAMDEDDEEKPRQMPDLPSRGINGARS